MAAGLNLFGLPREIGLKRSLCKSKEEAKRYITKLNGKSNLYTSLYSFQEVERTKPWKVDTTTAIIDRAWWDFDAGERGDIEQVKTDVRQLLSRLDGDCRVVATGRGFHVHQLFKRAVVGEAFHRHLQRYQRRMSDGLPTLDGFAFPAKLTRIPNTYNCTRKRWAVVIPPKSLMDVSFEIPKQPVKEWVEFCPFFGKENESNFDFVLWVNDNPEEKVQMHDFTGEVGSAGDIPLMPCLEKAVNAPSPTHEVRVALVQHMSQELRWFADPASLSHEQRREIEDTIFNYLKSLKWDNWNEYRSRQGIRTNIGYANAPSCRWYNLRGMCEGKCWRYDGTID